MRTISEARQEVQKCLRLAKELFGFDADVDISFDKRGRTAGTAHVRMGEYGLKFNRQLLQDEFWSELVDETIPHEVAHLVCFANPSLGKNHNNGWRRVCIALGGQGDRTHDMPLQRARTSRKAIYNIDGMISPIGLTVHRRIQQGRVYRMRGGGKICPTQFTGQIVEVK